MLFVPYEDMGKKLKSCFFMFDKQRVVCLHLLFVQPNSPLSLVCRNATQSSGCVSGYSCYCWSNIVTFICNCSAYLESYFLPRLFLFRSVIIDILKILFCLFCLFLFLGAQKFVVFNLDKTCKMCLCVSIPISSFT